MKGTPQIMAHQLKPLRGYALLCLLLALLPPTTATTRAQENPSSKSKEMYDKIKAVSLTGGSAQAKGLILRRDRAVMTFDGTFYFASPVEGHVTCAVFIGQGSFHADVPPSDFERDNVKRLLGTEVVESDFKTAVLKFSDDTFDVIGKNRQEGSAANERAQRLASDLDSRILKETGANLSARVTLSLLNAEQPGFFFANFDGGRRNRFSLLLDYQDRIPVVNFGLNGGEKGLIFAYKDLLFAPEIWTAFYSLEDYQRNSVEYSDTKNLIDVAHYDMELDLRDPGSKLRLDSRVTARTLAGNLKAVPFQVGEGLGVYDSERLKKQMRLRVVRVNGAEASAVQEDWEGGFTVFLSQPVPQGQQLEFEFQLEGDFMIDPIDLKDSFYPASNSTWYPQHGYLDRATFDLTFHHRKNRRVASVGTRLSETPDPDDKDSMVTKYQMKFPIPYASFAVGPFERHTLTVDWQKGGDPTVIEFNSLPNSYMMIKEEFILAELNNTLRYFSLLFGKYPYPVFNAAFHPFDFGQGLPSLVMIPAVGIADKWAFSFIAHETSHQWWGDVVMWRSYRDQWLSEGFAEYSGVLYAGLRASPEARDDLIKRMRQSLTYSPVTQSGVGKGKLADVGPIILGHRLSTSKTFGAYETLVYNKGALVLRMLHFLLSNVSDGDSSAFFKMMTDFVNRHRDSFASTDDFRVVANEYFAKSELAKKYGIKDLDWFFRQWVYQSGLPSYELEYQIQDQPDGSAVLSGNLIQENVPDDWFMPLPIIITFGDKQRANATVHALGPKTPFKLRLPKRPQKVELDPDRWILSEKTLTKAM